MTQPEKLFHDRSKTCPKPVTILPIVALCAMFAGMLIVLTFGSRRMTNHELGEVAAWLLGVWMITATIAIAIRQLRYTFTLLVAQVMSTTLCLVGANLADPDWNVIVGISCVGMIVGMVTGAGYCLYASEALHK